MTDFSISFRDKEMLKQLECFVDEQLIPLEREACNFDEYENIDVELLQAMRVKAKAQGLWAPQMPKSLGGMGLNFRQMCLFYEAAARSIFGPVVFNCAPPDDGNMQLLYKILDEAQREQWLMPLVRGEARSAFAMTEPDGGCGSDPGLTYTRAERQGNGWKISGRKWFTTGAQGADIFIIIAKTSDDPRKGLSAFLFHKDQPGWEIVRRIAIMGPEEHGGHCELIFDNLYVDDSQRLLNVGDGLKVTQMRLGPARLTHCMRWLGLARRSLEVCGEYIVQRQSFGAYLSEHEGVQWMLGNAVANIQQGRLLTQHAAYLLDCDMRAKKEISMAKIQVADTLHQAVDTAIQLCGARGYSKDTCLEWIYRYARQARLVDGASEVHKMVLSKIYLSEAKTFFDWRVAEEEQLK